MRQKRVQAILKQSRKNSKTGRVATELELNRLIIEYKKKKSKSKDEPKLKLSRRERRSLLVKKKKKIALVPKPKAHRWPRVRVPGKFGYRTL